MENVQDALKESAFFVEADSFARYALWIIHVQRPYPHGEAPIPKWPGNGCMGMGVTLQGGTHLMCWFDVINDQQVCFYYPTSTLIDWAEIKAFIYPFAPREKRCDAHNFGQCLNALETK